MSCQQQFLIICLLIATKKSGHENIIHFWQHELAVCLLQLKSSCSQKSIIFSLDTLPSRSNSGLVHSRVGWLSMMENGAFSYKSIIYINYSILPDKPTVILAAVKNCIHIHCVIFNLIKNQIPLCHKHLMIFIWWYVSFFKERKSLWHTF